MDKKNGQAAVDKLVKHYRKTKKTMNSKSIFEEYELICAEMENHPLSAPPKDIKKNKKTTKSHI